MGTLILFLVVLDRRAKIAARNKAIVQSATISQDREKEIAKRWEEWERQRQELQERLQAQQTELIVAKTDVEQQQRQTASEIAAERARQLQIKDKLAADIAKLKQSEQALRTDQTKLEQVKQKTPKASDDIVQLGFEVKELEETLSTLKEQRDQAKNTFSVVPYKGSQGADRKPIYVEVAAEGVIFHPDRKTFSSVWLESDMVRSEIMARADKVDSADAANKNRAYVFFLVRPNGIENYYKAQNALRRLDIDYGYEFVEADWQLDFGAPNAAQQLAKLNAKTTTNALGSPTVPSVPGTTTGFTKGGTSPDGLDSSGLPPAGNGGLGTPGFGPNLPPTAGNSTAPAGPVVGGTNVLGGPTDMPPGTGDPLTEMPPAGYGPGKKAPIASILPPTGAKALAGPAQTANIAGSAGPSQALPSPNFVPANRPQVAAAEPMPVGSGLDTVQSRSVPAPTANQQPIVGTPPPTTAELLPQKQATDLANQLRSRMTEAPKNATTVNSPMLPNTPPGETSGQAGQPGTGGSGSSFETPELPVSPGAPSTVERKRKTAPPVSRLIGSREFVVTVACTADGVTVQPRGKTFAAATLQRASRDSALAREVRDLINERQATVSNEEPPYRPEIRFRVGAEGRRTFFLAYPLLEDLGVTMTREDAD